MERPFKSGRFEQINTCPVDLIGVGLQLLGRTFSSSKVHHKKTIE
jgi:hypothetical protein